jgi:hypothetical protein
VTPDTAPLHGIRDLHGHLDGARVTRVPDPAREPDRAALVLGDEDLVLPGHDRGQPGGHHGGEPGQPGVEAQEGRPR